MKDFFQKAVDWLKANKTGLIVGAAAGGTLAWVFRATIARVFGG